MTARLCPTCRVNELPPRYRKCDDCVAAGAKARTASAPAGPMVVADLPAGARRCPECGVNELEGRSRKCDDCVAGVTIDRKFTSLAEVPRYRVVSRLRGVGERPVDLGCGCELVCSLWQEDEVDCSTHGPTWVARITRTSVRRHA